MNGEVSDYFTGQSYEAPKGMSRPVSDHMVAGYIHDNKTSQWVFDYNNGIEPIENAIKWEMPTEVKDKSPISLWNLALEIHTGRILEQFIGVLYLLYIPIAGICVLMVLISGFFVWLLKHRN